MDPSPRKKKTHPSFRPVNTLSSSRLPSVSTSNDTDHSRISIGDASSLFDTTDGSLEVTDYPNSWKNNMARERRPSAEPPSHSSQPQSSHPQDATPPKPLANKPSLQQPEFGKASPLRNPLRPDSHSNTRTFRLHRSTLPGRPILVARETSSSFVPEKVYRYVFTLLPLLIADSLNRRRGQHLGSRHRSRVAFHPGTRSGL